MGEHQSTIQLNNSYSYQGGIKSLEEQTPHGKGFLLHNQIPLFEGKFQQGKAICGRLVIQRNKRIFQYEGSTNNGSLSGLAKLSIRMSDSSQNTDRENYDGKFENGKMKEGKATKEEVQIEGTFNEDGRLQGYGSKSDLKNEVAFVGEFSTGNLPQGKITFNKEKESYQGSLKDGKPNGKGTYASPNFKSQGYFKAGIPEQHQKVDFANGDRYEGGIKEGLMHGKGRYRYLNGTVYEGDFYKGQMQGLCKITYQPQPTKKISVENYEGQVDDGLYSGPGVLEYSNGMIYKGYFNRNKKNGQGILIVGETKYRCLFVMDQLVGQLKKMD